MLDDYLIVHKSILPDYYEKVIEAKQLIDTGAAKNVSAAVKMVGISRGTFYKYKDYVQKPSNERGGRKAVLAMLLNHEAGVLSAMLTLLTECGCNILTITQSLPVHHLASVTITVDIVNVHESPEELIAKLSAVSGVEKPKLIAVE